MPSKWGSSGSWAHEFLALCSFNFQTASLETYTHNSKCSQAVATKLYTPASSLQHADCISYRNRRRGMEMDRHHSEERETRKGQLAANSSWKKEPKDWITQLMLILHMPKGSSYKTAKEHGYLEFRQNCLVSGCDRRKYWKRCFSKVW